MSNLNQPVVRVAFADDHVIVREGIAQIINSFGDFTVVIQAKDGYDLIEKIERADVQPDICILDINMPRKNGWATLAELKQRWSSIKVLFMSVLYEANVINDAVMAGVNGYLSKSCNPDELRIALRNIYEEGYYYPSEFSKVFFGNIAQSAKSGLTNRELQFLELCCDDSSYKEIADRMHVSPRTVEGYRDSLFSKLKLKTRMGLAMYAIKNGIVAFFERK
jgi:DNA-binding NarL/FixJ family response regulator